MPIQNPWHIRETVAHSNYSQESLNVASGAQIPASCVLACYWSMVVCYWGISQSQTTTQLAGIWAPLHGDQQHTGTLVKMSNIACMSAHQYYVTAFRHQSVCAVLPLEEKVISFSIRCENTKYIFMNVSVL